MVVKTNEGPAVELEQIDRGKGTAGQSKNQPGPCSPLMVRLHSPPCALPDPESLGMSGIYGRLDPTHADHKPDLCTEWAEPPLFLPSTPWQAAVVWEEPPLCLPSTAEKAGTPLTEDILLWG